VADTPTDRLRKLGITLPPPPRPVGTYVPVTRSGSLAWVSGQIATDQGAVVRPGAVDRDVPLEEAQTIARRATLQAVSALGEALGSIDRIRSALRVGVFVAVSPGFHREHEVANGATQLLVDLLGEAGRPARSTVGVAGLPLGAPVEVDLLVEIG
jgi:enamine deaminase RidA (YjgF/YER057c/UK114 family)